MTDPLPTAEFEPTISDEMIAEYRANGFTWVERITTDEEIEWLRGVFDQLFADRRGGVDGGYFDLSRPYEAEGEDHLPQVLVPELAVPQLEHTLFRRNATRDRVEIARRRTGGARRVGTHDLEAGRVTGA